MATDDSAPRTPRAAPAERLVLGLMSGMSMDGLDAALVRMAGAGERPTVALVAATTRAYDDALRERLQAARGPAGPESAALDEVLAEAWADIVATWLDELDISRDDILCCGSHGQTLFHRPRADGAPAETLQVGAGSILAARLGVPVVSDFRQADVAAGGEGAPLVPMADWILHGHAGATTACNNLGSISNVTVLPPRREDVLAFDTGPANMLIDAFARHGFGDIDRDGIRSAAGSVHDDVLLTLYVQRAAWLAQPPPRSAGYETFGPSLVEHVLAAHPDVAAADLVRTAVAFTAGTLAEAYERFVLTRHPDLAGVTFSGGGTRNPTLMGEIRSRLAPLGLALDVLDGPLGDAQEAVAFALLADRTWRGLPGNIPSATGAAGPVVLGRVDLP